MRQAKRVAIEAFVKVAGKRHQFVFRTRDLSRTGLFLYTRVPRRYPFQVGSELDIELYDWDVQVQLRALVVRSVQRGSNEAEQFPLGFGLKIQSITPENLQRLDRLIARAEKGEEPY